MVRPGGKRKKFNKLPDRPRRGTLTDIGRDSKVRIKKGPHRGYEGQIVSFGKYRDIVNILKDGRRQKVEIKIGDLEELLE